MVLQEGCAGPKTSRRERARPPHPPTLCRVEVPENAVIGFQWNIQSVNQSSGCDPFILCHVLSVRCKRKGESGSEVT